MFRSSRRSSSAAPIRLARQCRRTWSARRAASSRVSLQTRRRRADDRFLDEEETLTVTRMPLIEISSSDPRERGRQYGEAAREQIERSIAYYAESFERSACLSWERVLEHVPLWSPQIDAYLPDILEEVGGIAEGANRRVEEILALNGRGELSAANPFADDAEEGCSSFAIMPEAAGDGHVYCGQNWDWREQTTDTVVVLRIEQPPRPTIVMLTEAGQVGRQGANSAGIALN